MPQERKIVISGDLSSLESAFERGSKRVSQSLGGIGKSLQDVEDSVDKAGKSIDGKLQELEQETSSLFESMTKDAEKFGRTSQERAQYLKDEIDLIKRAAKEETAREKLKSKSRLDESKGKGGKTAKKAGEQYQKETAEIDSRSKMAEMQARALETRAKEYSKKDKDKKEEEDEGGGGGRDRKINTFEKARSIPRQAFNAGLAAAGFGAVLSIAGFVGSMISEGVELESAQAQAGARGKVRTGGIRGMKTADALRYNMEVTKELGYGAGVGSREADRMGNIEKSLGLDMGTIKSGARVLRAEESGKTPTQVTSEMLAIMKNSDLYNIGKGDFTMVGELLERNNELNELQASKTDKIDSLASTQLMAAFGNVGGKFGDARQAGTLSTMNQAITDPSNDFKRAFIMSSIAKSNPEASYVERMKMQEQGIFGEGRLSSLMGDLQKYTGGGDSFTVGINKLFDDKLGYGTSENLRKAYEANPEMFANIKNEEDVRRIADPSLKRAMSTGGVSRIESDVARFKNWQAENGAAAIDKVYEYKDEYDKSGFGGLASKLGSDIVSAIEQGFKKATEITNIKESPIFKGFEVIGDIKNDEELSWVDKIDKIFGGPESWLDYSMDKGFKKGLSKDDNSIESTLNLNETNKLLKTIADKEASINIQNKIDSKQSPTENVIYSTTP